MDFDDKIFFKHFVQPMNKVVDKLLSDYNKSKDYLFIENQWYFTRVVKPVELLKYLFQYDSEYIAGQSFLIARAKCLHETGIRNSKFYFSFQYVNVYNVNTLKIAASVVINDSRGISFTSYEIYEPEDLEVLEMLLFREIESI